MKWTIAGSLIWQARTDARLTQRDLAALTGVPQSTIGAIERGRRQPSLPLLERLVAGAGKEVRFVLATPDDHDATVAPDRSRDQRVANLFRSARRAG